MLVSPAERPLPLRRLGQTSSVPERYGADFMWVANRERHGVQRKEIKDYVASMIDGRLSREVGQMKQLTGIRALVLEGTFTWTPDGFWTGPVRWDRFRHRQGLFTLANEGIWIIPTEGIADSAETIAELERWTRKPKHTFARARAKATGQWGKPSSREFACYMLQGLPGVGPELAERLYDALGLPMAWTVSEKELRTVEGVGPKRASAMYSCLPSPDAPGNALGKVAT